MKKFSLYSLLAMTLAIGFYACQDMSTSTPASTTATQTIQTSIVHPTYDVQLATYVSPTIEMPAGFNPGNLNAFFPQPPPPPPPPPPGGPNSGNSNTFGDHDGDGHSHTFTPPPPPPHGGGNSNTFGDHDGGNSNTITIGGGNNGGKRPIMLPYIPWNLALTSAELTQIQTLAQTYLSCVEAEMAVDRPLMLNVITTENTERKGTLDSLRKGLITRKQAMVSLNGWDQTARTQLQTIAQDPIFCNCLQTYISGVQAVLVASPDQQTIWDAYIAKLKGYCFPITP